MEIFFPFFSNIIIHTLQRIISSPSRKNFIFFQLNEALSLYVAKGPPGGKLAISSLIRFWSEVSKPEHIRSKLVKTVSSPSDTWLEELRFVVVDSIIKLIAQTKQNEVTFFFFYFLVWYSPFSIVDTKAVTIKLIIKVVGQHLSLSLIANYIFLNFNCSLFCFINVLIKNKA